MNSFYWVFYTLFKSISKAFFSWKVVNREKLIEDGPVLIVSNHQSFLDPPMLGISYEDGIYFFAKHAAGAETCRRQRLPPDMGDASEAMESAGIRK